ncbi:MAG TPA: hypothetical protein VLT36_19480 [Candidatus Dormibacteraeota bacterium]|nr:hypothetical protein [Candidatus Dormibacteraeota bacterium]
MTLTARAILLAALTLGVLAYISGTRRVQAPKPISTESRRTELAESAKQPAAPLTSPLTTEAAGPMVEENAVAPAERLPATNKKERKPAQANKPAKEPLKDPDARLALSMVGADPDAEAYWFGAINDPALPAHERQDLIEDLNEDGLSDPKHPAPEDLPLILNRLQLIELLGPSAMDKVNADAFEEAYKDLLNLANMALAEGKPVN